MDEKNNEVLLAGHKEEEEFIETTRSLKTLMKESKECRLKKEMIQTKTMPNTVNIIDEQIGVTKAIVKAKEVPTFHVYPDIPTVKTYTVRPQHNTVLSTAYFACTVNPKHVTGNDKQSKILTVAP